MALITRMLEFVCSTTPDGASSQVSSNLQQINPSVADTRRTFDKWRLKSSGQMILCPMEICRWEEAPPKTELDYWVSDAASTFRDGQVIEWVAIIVLTDFQPLGHTFTPAASPQLLLLSVI